MGEDSGLPRGPGVIARVLLREEVGGPRKEMIVCCLEAAGRGLSRETQPVSRGWKRKGTRVSLSDSRGNVIL